MTKIVLLCAAGMSTSALVRKMKDAAKAEGYECDISPTRCLRPRIIRALT